MLGGPLEGDVRAPPSNDTATVSGSVGVSLSGSVAAGSSTEWITNDRKLRALIAEMRRVATQATELIMHLSLIHISEPTRPY